MSLFVPPTLYLLFCTIFEKVIGEFIRWFDQWKIHFMNINYDV